MKRGRPSSPLPLEKNSYVVTIFTYIKRQSTTISLWPPRSFPEHIQKHVLYNDLVLAATKDEAIEEGLEHYRHQTLPHLTDRPAPMGAWRQHLESFDDNFYIDAAFINTRKLEENTALLFQNWIRNTRDTLLEGRLVIKQMMHPHT